MSIEDDSRNNEDSISVVIVNYNAGVFLATCVRAVLSQVDELVVVDNASVDASLELLIHHFPAEPKLSIIRNAVNVGFATACNIGGRQTKGRYILFLNPDCRVEADAIPQLFSALESNESVGMVGGLLLNVDGTEQGGSRRAVPTPWRSFVRAFGLNRFANRWPRLFFDFHLHKQPLPLRPIEVEAISGACMLVNREAMEGVDWWDEGYFLHCEDLDLCMRFRQQGWNILFVPTARIPHVLGVCGRNRPIFVAWHKHKSMLRFYRKFFRHQYPGGLMWLVIFGVWLRFGLMVCHNAGQRAARIFRVERG